MDEWIRLGPDRNPRFEHAHADGTRHEADRTIPMMTVEGMVPRKWQATFVCRSCRETIDHEWDA